MRVFGPCPTCGQMFESRDRKIFCSMNCYHRSERFKEITAERAAQQRKLDPRACRQCGEAFTVKPSSRSKFCSKDCSRKYFAERHDRWVANPEKIALPQAYDEFLSKDELPCIIDGCGWAGKHLANHVNLVHGITAAELKELAGFNRSTGLISATLSQALCERPYRHLRANPERIAEQMIEMRSLLDDGIPSGARRLQSRERSRKQLAERRASPEAITYTCQRCSAPFVRAGMKTLAKYCSTCRPLAAAERAAAKVAPLVCANCKSEFIGLNAQRRRVERGLPVVCSLECRQQITKEARVNGRRRSAKKNVPERGPCQTCGKIFYHYSPLIFCSRVCYQASPNFKIAQAKATAASARKMVSTP